MPTLLRRFALLLAVILAAYATSPASAAVEVQRVVSPGGIEAWLVEDHANPVVSLALAFRGGAAALDRSGKEGTTELLAAMMNEGAGDLDSQAFQRALEENSIDFRFDAGRDAFEGSIRTLTRHRDLAFDLLRLALTVPRFDADAVDRVRAQLLASLAQKVEDPDYIAARAWWRLAFPDHPYGRPVDGTAESVAALGADDLRGAVGEAFARDRLVLAAVGDITASELALLLDRTFGQVPAASPAVEVPRAEPVLGDTVVIERDVPQSVAVFGQGGIDRDDPDFYAAYVLNYILGGGGFASRLTEEVREKRGLAYGVSTYLNTLEHSAVWQGQVATQNERVAESLHLIRDEWRRMAETGPTAEELSDAKTYLTGSFPLRLTSTGSLAGFLVDIQLQELGIDYVEKRNGLIEAVSLDDVKRVAARLMTPDRLSFVIVGRPKGVEPTRAAPG